MNDAPVQLREAMAAAWKLEAEAALAAKQQAAAHSPTDISMQARAAEEGSRKVEVEATLAGKQ